MTISLSLNEVETLAAKASRGAGLDWGLAEDVGRAARRLAEAGRPWAEAILGLASEPGPALTGALLADDPPRAPTSIDGVASPSLAVAMAAGALESLRFRWPDAEIVVARGRIASAVGAGLDCPDRATISAAPAREPVTTLAAAQTPCVDERTFQTLERLALRTTVPASAHSRLAGAGAGTTDND